MNLDRATRLCSALCSQVGRVSGFSSTKDTKVVMNPIAVDARKPAILAARNAHEAVRVVSMWPALVLLVHMLRNVAQVGYCVVAWVAVHVVKLTFRPLATDVQPRQSVRSVVVSCNANFDVAAAIGTAGRWFGCGLTSRSKPAERAGLAIVGKQSAKTRGGKIGSSHEAPQLLIGQRLPAISSRSGASLFYQQATQ